MISLRHHRDAMRDNILISLVQLSTNPLADQPEYY